MRILWHRQTLFDVLIAVKADWQLIQLRSTAIIFRNPRHRTWCFRGNVLSCLLKHITLVLRSLFPSHKPKGRETRRQFQGNWESHYIHMDTVPPPYIPSLLISRERTRSLLFPTRMIGVCGWDSLRRRRSWAVRWKLRLSVTEKTRMHTSHCRVDKSWGSKHTHRCTLIKHHVRGAD